jgi:hypothetical protein
MALEMRRSCEKCNASLHGEGEAHICSYECTFCAPCTEAMNRILSKLRRGTGATAEAAAEMTEVR